jgi:hypothetical protein
VALWEPKEPGAPWRYKDQRDHCQDATIADLLRYLGARPTPPGRDDDQAGRTATEADFEPPTVRIVTEPGDADSSDSPTDSPLIWRRYSPAPSPLIWRRYS